MNTYPDLVSQLLTYSSRLDNVNQNARAIVKLSAAADPDAMDWEPTSCGAKAGAKEKPVSDVHKLRAEGRVWLHAVRKMRP